MKNWKAWLPDTLMVLGGTALAYGAGLVYLPAGFIVAGALLIVGGILAERSAK